MTREERLDWLCRLRSNIPVYMPYEWIKSMNEALTDSIKELEQEPKTDILDKIKEEIQTLRDPFCYYSEGIIDDVEDIIDKYRKSE